MGSKKEEFNNCFFASNMGLNVDSAAYLILNHCSFSLIGRCVTNYLLNVKGEYFYANNCYFEGYDFSQKEENNLVSTLNLDSIYNFFNNSDADVFINGIYNNNGVNIDVPIKITNTSVMIGNSDTFNKYGICYCYSVLKNNIIKVIHKPSSADDKYNMIRSIYINDKDFKNNLLININDLPMQYLKYLDCLYKVEENNKLDSGNKDKGKIKNLFKKMKKNS